MKIITKNNVKTAAFAVFALVGIIIAILAPFDISSTEFGVRPANVMVGVILITLAMWIFKPFDLPYSIGGIFLLTAALVVGLPNEAVFDGFTSNAIWTLIPALFFGLVLQKTGLGKRIALFILTLKKQSGFTYLMISQAISGIILSVLTPSIMVRIAIIVPIAVQIASLAGLKPKTKAHAAVILMAFAMALIPGGGWLTGVLWGPIIQGAFAGVYEISFINWAMVSLVPSAIITILTIVGGLIFFKNEQKLVMTRENVRAQHPARKISKEEVVSSFILVAAFTLFATSMFHGIGTVMVCMGAVFLFFATKVLDIKDINTKINWDMVVFIACALSLGPIFTYTGIGGWLSEIVVPNLAPIAGNPWIFVFSVTIFLFIWGFVDVASFIPTIVIVASMAGEISARFNISPLVWIVVLMMSGNAFFMAYRNIWALMTKSLAGENAPSAGQLAKFGTVYFVACMVALVVAIPLWTSLGLFG